MAPRNLLNIERVGKDYGKGPVLADVSLGVAEGERIGIVGRNGGGKSTLMRIMSGRESADDGRVTRGNDVRLGLLAQIDDFAEGATVRSVVLGNRDEHEWAGDPLVRDVLTGILGGFDAALLDRSLQGMSGGERRRVALARLLTTELDLLLLDEPTNHLDVEAIAWLAGHLRSRRGLAVVVVTHDRWFLDEFCERMWEVVAGQVEDYEGGYSAYVLAKAERSRQAFAEDSRRRNLMRKELAWLRRGAPARTSKPKFRVDAANELIAGEPPARDSIELLGFAGARLGKSVFEMRDIDLSLGDKRLLHRVTWNIGPGDRIAIVGVNGAGKTSLVRLLLGEIRADGGKLVTGKTVKPAYLSQHLEELNPEFRVLESVEHIAQRVDLGKGRELTASQLCERLGFGADAQWTPVGDLSGGERRRLQLTRLLMAGPNVLVLDEPTNDFDVETLAALEDLLDGFAGTLLVISHDRYFLERVSERFVGLLGDGHVRDLPAGIEEYLRLRSDVVAEASGAGNVARVRPAAADERSLRKEVQRLERQMEKIEDKVAKLHAEMALHATDYGRVAELDGALRALHDEKSVLEEAWMAAMEALDG
ncbi:MAG: ABC-F family ATP-binding cassette domain-containing protein [Candidatus Nanopelagicales bacterium]